MNFQHKQLIFNKNHEFAIKLSNFHHSEWKFTNFQQKYGIFIKIMNFQHK